MPSTSQIGEDIRTWTAGSIYESLRGRTAGKMRAAKRLASIRGQSFPRVAYRAFGIDPKKVQSWSELTAKMRSDFPESFSSSLKGLKQFLRDCGPNGTALVFQVDVNPQEWMFSVPDLAKLLDSEELRAEDAAGFGIKAYLAQEEIVARPGTLKRALLSGRTRLIGYELPDYKFKWIAPRPVEVSSPVITSTTTLTNIRRLGRVLSSSFRGRGIESPQNIGMDNEAEQQISLIQVNKSYKPRRLKMDQQHIQNRRTMKKIRKKAAWKMHHKKVVKKYMQRFGRQLKKRQQKVQQIRKQRHLD